MAQKVYVSVCCLQHWYIVHNFSIFHKASLIYLRLLAYLLNYLKRF